MTPFPKFALCTAAALALTGTLCGGTAAQEISRLPGTNPNALIAPAVIVPPGLTTYYISGTTPSPATPGGPLGDTPAQTASTLGKLKDTLAQLGLTFGDVVKATVFLVGDPAKGGEMDFAGMNAEWAKHFGTAQQPGKPARSTVKVAGLAAPGLLVEIELIAAKKQP